MVREAFYWGGRPENDTSKRNVIPPGLWGC